LAESDDRQTEGAQTESKDKESTEKNGLFFMMMMKRRGPTRKCNADLHHRAKCYNKPASQPAAGEANFTAAQQVLLV
jgi:hypothetical protein